MPSFTTFTTQNITVATTKSFDLVIATLDNVIDRNGDKPWGRVRRQALSIKDFERVSHHSYFSSSKAGLIFVYRCRVEQTILVTLVKA